MIDSLIIGAGYLFAGITMLAGLFAVIWMMFQAGKIILIVMKIHSTASKKPYGHNFAWANFFDAKVLDEKEKKMRSEGFSILYRLLPVAFIYGTIVAALAIFTS